MSNVIKMPDLPKHVFELDYCAGCGIEITDRYAEIGMTNFRGTQIKHIALCLKCNEVAKKNAAY